MASAQGEDRSDYQSVFPPVDRNGKKLDFILFKATEGTSWVSSTYARNIALAKQYGVPFGSYHFLHPSLDIPQQVALFLATVSEHGGLVPGAMLACDSEISVGSAGTLLMSNSGRSSLLTSDPITSEAVRRKGVVGVRSFTDGRLDASGVNVGQATNQFLTDVRTGVEVALGGDYCQELCYTYEAMLPRLSECIGWPLWLAYYSNTSPASVHPWNDWTIWQYAGGGGNDGSDQDGFNGDVVAFTAWVNAKKKPVPQPTADSTFSVTMPGLGIGERNPDWFTLRAQWLIAGIGKKNDIPNTQIADDADFGPLTEKATREIQVYARIAKDLASASGKIGEAEWQFLIAGKFGSA